MTLGATLATDEVAQGVSGGGEGPSSLPLMHGPTFMGNPLACAVANASLELLLSSPWQERVSTLESQLRAELAPCASSNAVRDVRVLGAIGVVELEEPLHLASASRFLVDRGVWLRPFGRLLYTMPPFITNEEDTRRITSVMHDVVKAVEQGAL